MKRIVYILGAGRSGTTLLDIILGNNPGVFSGGELNRFVRGDGRPPACEPGTDTALFWEGFRQSLAAKLDLKNFRSMQREIRKHEYHGAFARLLSERTARPSETYARYIRTFMETMNEQCPSDILVDSSKYPMRGYYLSRLAPCPVSFVYLKRNPVDVIRSFSRRDVQQPGKSWLMTNLYLFSVHCICTYLCRQLKNRHAVHVMKYEELAGDPESSLRKLSLALDLNLEQSIRKIRDQSPLTPGLLFEGNRLRLQSEVTILQPAARQAYSLTDRVTLWLNRGWWP